MLYRRFGSKYVRHIFLVVTLLILLGSVGTSTAYEYFSLSMISQTTISPPEVTLQEGTVGASTIYANSTSAKVSVTAPIYDFVDINTGDVDSITNKGTHSNFTAQQNGPDSIYDTLTEENIAVAGNIAKVGTDTSGSGINLTLSFSHTLVSGTARIVIVSIGVENGDTIDVSTVTYGGVTMTLAVEGITGTSGFRYLAEIWYILENDLPSDGSQTVEINCTGTAYELEVNGFSSEYTGVTQGAPEAADEHNQTTGSTIANDISPSDNAWVISAVGAGNTGSWTHGEGQVEVLDFTDASSAFAVAELRGASGETSLSSTYSGTVNRLERVAASWLPIEEDNYELDLEIQWESADYTRTNEELCIKTGTFTGSENIQVRVWNSTGSSWDWIMNLTANQWNNVSVTSYLTSSTFTVQFLGGTETGDTTQDSWNIDATLLHVWTNEGNYDYVDNDTSDVDSSADLGSLVDFDNMKATDSTYANLTESTSGGGITYINEAEASATAGTSAQVNKPTNTQEDDFMIALLVSTIGADTDGSTMSSAPSGWTSQYNYTQTAISGQHVYIYWKVAGASEPSSYTWTWTSSCGWVAQITTFRGVDTGSPIHVEGTVNQESSNSPMSPSVTTTVDNAMIWLYDMSDDVDVPPGGGAPGGTTWIDQTEIATPGNGIGISTAYFVQASAGATGNQDWTLDAIEENSGQQYALKPAFNYQLDQEVQWTSTDYTKANEELCIRTGTFSGSETIQVKVWNSTGSSWHWIMNLTVNQWNNVSIAPYLTSSVFTVQFIGGIETSDASQDSWNIDAALMNVGTIGTFDYVLRVNNTVTDSWQIRLKKYSDSNLSRLQNGAIYFHNSTDGNSNQIEIQNGSYINQTGAWYDLGGSETIYIAMTVQANSTGTSHISAYLEVRKPGTSIYAQYVITFEIT